MDTDPCSSSSHPQDPTPGYPCSPCRLLPRPNDKDRAARTATPAQATGATVVCADPHPPPAVSELHLGEAAMEGGADGRPITPPAPLPIADVSLESPQEAIAVGRCAEPLQAVGDEYVVRTSYNPPPLPPSFSSPEWFCVCIGYEYASHIFACDMHPTSLHQAWLLLPESTKSAPPPPCRR